jgi:hypothetical protein
MEVLEQTVQQPTVVTEVQVVLPMQEEVEVAAVLLLTQKAQGVQVRAAVEVEGKEEPLVLQRVLVFLEDFVVLVVVGVVEVLVRQQLLHLEHQEQMEVTEQVDV